MLYFDHAATTPPHREVVDTIAEIMIRHYGNPSALHKAGEEAARLLNKAREVAARALTASPEEIIFTSGATEGNNMAIKGAAMQYRARGRHLVTTMTEHPSVYETIRQMEGLGWDVSYIPVDENGTADPEKVAAEVRKDTVLVSVMHVNNETGAVQPLQEIGRRIKERNSRTLFHIDGVQGFGKLPVELDAWQADLYTLSAHKFNGPKGAGVLYVRNGVELFPLLAGGSQESGHRAGTENVASAAAVAKAMRLAAANMESFHENTSVLKKQLMKSIEDIPGLLLNSTEAGAPHIVNFSYPGMKPEVMVHTLEEEGILVSTKSACSSRTSKPSRVLLGMGRGKDEAASGIRVSFGHEHTEADVLRLAAALRDAVEKLRPLTARKGK